SARELTAESELIFNHLYEIERRWDGGIIEISTNNGVSWTDLGPNITQNGYTELVRNSFNAFSNSSGGWIETKVDLSAYAGENVLIRWNMIFDISISWEGWYVDDIQLTNLNVNVLNSAQISNGNITSTTFVDEPTRINFTPICEQNNNFSNGDIAEDDYRVDNNITSSGTVKTGTSVGFYAGSSITLTPGFHAESGSNFLAKIEGCNPNSANNTVPPIAQARLANLSPNQNQSLHVFPNPFRQQTTIEFKMAEAGRLWIGLQDLTGRTIEVIRQATNHPVGSNQVILQNEGLKSGIYWLTMQTEQGITTKKLFLLE
ncbi:MAG: 3-coathanger stack domain-containing protein, partial [Bacteroidota bacterium]